MSQYLLSTFEIESEVPGAPQTPEEMKSFMERVVALEDEIESTGASTRDADRKVCRRSAVLTTPLCARSNHIPLCMHDRCSRTEAFALGSSVHRAR